MSDWIETAKRLAEQPWREWRSCMLAIEEPTRDGEWGELRTRCRGWMGPAWLMEDGMTETYWKGPMRGCPSQHAFRCTWIALCQLLRARPFAPTVKEIADAAGYDRQVVSEALSYMRAGGLVDWEEGVDGRMVQRTIHRTDPMRACPPDVALLSLTKFETWVGVR